MSIGAICDRSSLGIEAGGATGSRAAEASQGLAGYDVSKKETTGVGGKDFIEPPGDSYHRLEIRNRTFMLSLRVCRSVEPVTAY